MSGCLHSQGLVFCKEFRFTYDITTGERIRKCLANNKNIEDIYKCPLRLKVKFRGID